MKTFNKFYQTLSKHTLVNNNKTIGFDLFHNVDYNEWFFLLLRLKWSSSSSSTSWSVDTWLMYFFLFVVFSPYFPQFRKQSWHVLFKIKDEQEWNVKQNGKKEKNAPQSLNFKWKKLKFTQNTNTNQDEDDDDEPQRRWPSHLHPYQFLIASFNVLFCFVSSLLFDDGKDGTAYLCWLVCLLVYYVCMFP